MSPATLTFTSGNWNSAQTVTVTGINDDLVDGTQTSTITMSVVDASSDNNFDSLNDQTVSVTTADTDVAGFTKIESGGSTTVAESGTTDTFTVVLDAQPASNVVISVTSGDTGEATVSPATLTFTSGNWNSAQTVTVTGVNDSLIDGSQNTTITMSIVDGSSDDSFDSLNDQTVTVSTADNDTAGFTVVQSGGSTSVDESGTTDTFTVVLDAQPTSNVVISVTSNDTTEATVSPATLTFTSGNWNSAQTVTITGADDNAVDGPQGTSTILSVVDESSDDHFDAASDQTVSVTTTDNDTASFTVVQSGGSTSVAESGTTDTFTVVLGAQPTSDVTLSVTSGDTGEATVSTETLQFTSGNWNSAQTVTVTGVDDSLIDGSQNTTITVSVVDSISNDSFDPLNDQTVTATTTDNDTAGFTVVQSGGSTSVAESGTTDTFTVVLNAQPNSNVVISVSSGDTGEATVSPSTLTFTSGNWNSAQTVTVTGVNDNLVDGTQTSTLTLSVVDGSSDNNFDAINDQTVSATTTDNDTAGFTVVQSGGSTSVAESGSTDTFTVVLDAQPNSNVVISVASGDTGEATVSPATLTFTSGNWNSTQTVTVTGVNDNLIDGTQTSTLTLSVVDGSSDNNFDPVNDQTVSATTTDNDTAGFTVVQSGGSTSVAETGSTDTFTVVLDAQPTSNVVISVASGDTGEATVSPATLTFTSGNWNSAQTVTVTGVDDSLVDGSQTTVATISVVDASSDDDFDGVANQTVSITTTNDDTAGFTIAISGGSTSVAESGSTDTFTVVLDAQPTSNVVISVASGDTGEATVSPATLTFTSGNWNSAQTVTVTGVDDSLVDGSQTTAATISVVDGSSDDDFDGVANQTTNIETTDNDSVGFTLVESSGSTTVNESGTTDTFTVVLNVQPSSNVVFSITSGDTGEATVTSALTFTPANWNSAQTVTVTGANDNIIDGTQTSTVTVSIVDANSDDDFDSVPDRTVSVATADDDVAGFTIAQSGGSTSVAETGSTDTFTVVLNAQPASNVVLLLLQEIPMEATVTSALTFTSGNWNSAQTVTVTGVDDNLVDGTQTSTITVAVNDGSSDNNFDPVVDQTVSVTTTDNDTAGFTIAQSGGSTSVSESGTTDTFTVVLNAGPTSDVVLSITSGDTGEATVTSSLTFTPANWNSAQTVTVTGADDNLIDGTITSTITVSVNDANSNDSFDGVVDQTVSVTTTDNDTAGFTIAQSGGSTSVSESGTTDTFTIVLNAQPSSNVVFSIASSDTGEATVISTLEFTASNWNSAQTVTLTGVDDNIIDGTQNSTTTVSIIDAITDDAFDGVADQTVSVTTTDNDTAGFTIAQSGGSTSVAETGTTDTFTVVLNAQPASNVVISVTSGIPVKQPYLQQLSPLLLGTGTPHKPSPSPVQTTPSLTAPSPQQSR